MSNRQHPRLSRRAAERLLDGHSDAGSPGLASLLGAARASTDESTPPGEDRAVALFRASSSMSPLAARRRPSMLKTALAQLAAAKILTAGVVAAAATGGVALAASTDHLPHIGGSSTVASPSTTESPDTEGDQPTEEATDGQGGTEGTDVGTDGDTDPAEAPGDESTDQSQQSADEAATPSPSLTGLCRAYQAGATSHGGKAAQNPAFTALVTAAGGVDAVSEFCVTLIGEPTVHGNATDHPTGPPAEHPGGGPKADQPKGPPAGHSSGPKTDHPAGGPKADQPKGPKTDHPTKDHAAGPPSPHHPGS